MRAHWQSETRKFNRHWQSSELGGGYYWNPLEGDITYIVKGGERYYPARYYGRDDYLTGVYLGGEYFETIIPSIFYKVNTGINFKPYIPGDEGYYIGGGSNIRFIANADFSVVDPNDGYEAFKFTAGQDLKDGIYNTLEFIHDEYIFYVNGRGTPSAYELEQLYLDFNNKWGIAKIDGAPNYASYNYDSEIMVGYFSTGLYPDQESNAGLSVDWDNLDAVENRLFYSARYPSRGTYTRKWDGTQRVTRIKLQAMSPFVNTAYNPYMGGFFYDRYGTLPRVYNYNYLQDKTYWVVYILKEIKAVKRSFA